MPLKPAIFLDRDGVINRALVREGRPYAVRSLQEFSFLPGVFQAVKALRAAEFRIIVATNQPDVATGLISKDTIEAMHHHLRSVLPIDDIYVCYHGDADLCSCRKPKPGMLLEAATKWSVDLNQSFMIGDRWRDVSAGKAAGCKTFLIDSGYAETLVDQPDETVSSLLEASERILNPAIPPQMKVFA